MPEYARPPLPAPVFRTAAGEVVDYGNRWGNGSPAPDAYSTVAHPERFAPLHDVARALVEHVRRAHDVTITKHPGGVPNMGAGLPVLEAFQITPNGQTSVALTLSLTELPGVVLRLSNGKHVLLPDCGCDGCDDDVEGLVQDLETVVLSLAEGRPRGVTSNGQFDRLPQDSQPWPQRQPPAIKQAP